jgi:hypothetical protein
MSVKVSVNLSRKRSHNFDSDCVTVGVETEVQSLIDRPEELLREISGLFRLAETAIDQEFASLKQAKPAMQVQAAEAPTARSAELPLPPATAPGVPEPHEPLNGPALASGKQISFIRTLARRNKLSESQLSTHIGAVTGDVRPPESLTKRQAAQVIESLQPVERN